jgi:DNA-binding SARP family transcriptional activator
LAGIQIDRSALVARLSAVLDRGHLFLIAPAGFGKTIALEQTLAARGGDIARVRCTAADRHAGRLLDHLIGALRSAAPGTADVLGDTLALAFGPVDPSTAADQLVAEIERLVIDPLTIAFDDAEHLAEDPAAADIVGALLASDSEALRVAVASRRRLPIRHAKLRAEDRLTVVRPADLVFSAGECEEMLRRAGRTDVSESEVETAMAVTEGWPLGLALAFGARRTGAAPVPTVGGELSEFLGEEVLDGLDPEFRRQLLKASLPPELTPEVAAALGLDADFLGLAVGRELFLSPLPGAGERLAFHPLFREFLVQRLEDELDRTELRELHAALAGAISNERPLEAVEHWLAAGQEPEAVRLVGRNSQPLVRSSPEVVRDWIGRLSPAGRAEPAIQLIEGQLAMGEGRPEDAVPLLRGAADEWRRRGRRAVWTARFSLAQTFIVLGRFDEVPALAGGVDAPEAADALAAPMVGLMAALATGGSGRREEGQALLELALGHPLGGLLEPYRVAFRAYFVDWHAGRLDAGLEEAQSVMARLEELDPMRWLPYMLWYTSYLEEARGDIAASVDLLIRSRDTTLRYGLGAFPAAAAGALKAGCDARAGRLADAEVELARAVPHLTGSWFAYDAELTRAELASRAGNASAVLAAAERAHALVGRGYLGERLRAATLLAPLLERAGARARALAVVDAALAVLPPHARAPRLLALRAWLRDLGGDAGTLADLCLAFEHAGDQVRYLVRGEWSRIEPLVWVAVERGLLDATEVVAAVRDAFPAGEAVLELLDHPSAQIRRAAAAVVPASGHPEAAARLAALTTDPDPGVVAAAERGGRLIRDDPPPLAFTLFGSFALRRGGREVGERAWDRRVAARLVRYLLAHRDAAVPEDLLFEAFWPDRTTQAARRSLQVAVSAARAVLDPPGSSSTVLEARERSYRLMLRPGDTVDTDIFERAASAALADHGPDRVDGLRAAAALWGGDPMPEERYEGWSAGWRERLVDLHREVLTAVAQSCFEAADAFGAAAVGRQLVGLDPLNEGAHRTLMVAYARSGRRSHALRQFLDCRRELIDSLGIEPAEETAALQRAILAGEPV